MFYSYATKERYGDARDHDTKPYWCVVIEYEADDPSGPSRKYLTGPSEQNLTKEEARQKADELDIQYRRGGEPIEK